MLTGAMNRLWAALDRMPSTNAKIASGIILGYLTGVVYLTAVLLQKDERINAEAFAFWLTFVLVLDGLATWQFAKKRDTYAAPSPDSERASVPSEPPPAKPSQGDV